jgi:hypothetical protein
LDLELTEDMIRLLCIINEYTKGGGENNPIWIKELPMMVVRIKNEVLTDLESIFSNSI